MPASKQQLEQRRARDERLRHLRRAALHLPWHPRSGDRTREAASQRALNAILALGFVVEKLADDQAHASDVQAAISAANEAYRATNLHGETLEKAAAMDLVVEIRLSAMGVLDRGVAIEDVMCSPFFAAGVADLVTNIDHDAFRAAVLAWVASERAVRARGRRTGRTPDRWKATLKCLERFGLKNGISNEKNLKSSFSKARPNAIPLSDEWAAEAGIDLEY